MPASLMSFMTCTRLSFILPSWRTRVSHVLVSNQASPTITEGSRVLLSQVTSGCLRANSELLFSALQIHHGEKMATTLNRQMRK